MLAALSLALSTRAMRILEDATGVFFTGGDQLKITSQIGDTPVFKGSRKLYESGGVIAGTSAGASVVCETMLVSGEMRCGWLSKGLLKWAPSSLSCRSAGRLKI